MTTSQWYTSGCKEAPRARWVGDRIEIDPDGFVVTKVPDAVLQWKAPLISASVEMRVPLAFLTGVLTTESHGNQYAGSPAGAQGLMQLLPSTATLMAGRQVSADELKNNPTLNIRLGAKYLQQMLVNYSGNPIKAVAGYNAGAAYCTGKCLNRWGLRSDCDSNNVGVDYPTRVFGYTNGAVDAGLTSAQAQETSRISLLQLLVGGAATAAGIAWVASEAKKRRRR